MKGFIPQLYWLLFPIILFYTPNYLLIDPKALKSSQVTMIKKQKLEA